MDGEQVKHINSLRFSWHEHVLRDAEVRKHPTALVFAGHVMHKFSPTLGFAAISLRAAAQDLGLDKTSVIRARDFLLGRGWLQKLDAHHDGSAANAQPTRYTFAGGPEDLVFHRHETKTIEPPATEQAQLSLWKSEALSKTGDHHDTQ